MADILISASAQDKETAERLSRLFEARGLSVDWMPLDPAEPGNRSGIVRRRANARVTIALWSKQSVSDAQVLEDAREALRRGSLLTARREDIAPPPEFRASPIASLTGWDGSDSHIQAGRLLTETAKLLERTATRPALALASARLNRAPRGASGGGAAALRPSAYSSPAPAWPDAIAKAGVAVSAAPEVKSAVATAPVAVQQSDAAPEPFIAKSMDAAPAQAAATGGETPPAVRAAPEPKDQILQDAAAMLALTPAAVKLASDAAEEKLESRPAPVSFVGEPANDALPLRAAAVTVAETAPETLASANATPEPQAPAVPDEPTYQTFTFEPEPKPQSAPVQPRPDVRVSAPAAAPQARTVTAEAPREKARAKQPRSRKPFLREPRARTERDDQNHVVAILLGIVASVALLAVWLQQRPQDFASPAPQTPALSAPVQRADAPALSQPAESAAVTPEESAPVIALEPTPPAPPTQITIASDLPGIQPAPALPHVESAVTAPSPAPAIDAPATPQVFEMPPRRAPTVAPPPVEAQAPAISAPPAAKATAPVFAEAPARRAPAKVKSAAASNAKAQRLADVGRALDARVAPSTNRIPSRTIAALAGAAPTAPQALAQTADLFDPQPSLTALRFTKSEHAFHLPGLAPSMLGAWTPGPDAPAPVLNAPISDADWNAAPARRLAQSALSVGAYKDHLAKAQAGDRRAMLTLGLMRQTGIGEVHDDARAFAWLRRAALAGEPRALAEIGAYYAAGIGVPRDDARAARNFDRSATLGAAAGKDAIGWALATGRGLPADATAARAAFEDAAKAGDPLAMLNLGRMQADGLGGAKDLAAAKLSYGKAADQGFAPAQYALGVLLLLDRPTSSDGGSAAPRTQSETLAETLAALRVQQAAAQGYPPAQELLGALYLHGIGVAQDSAMARAWFARRPRA